MEGHRRATTDFKQKHTKKPTLPKSPQNTKTIYQPKIFRDPCLKLLNFITQDYFILFSKFSPRDFHDKLEKRLKKDHNVEIMKNKKN